MTSALVHLNGTQGSAPLVPDLEALGIRVLAVVSECSNLVQAVVRHAPDVVICDDPQPGEALFKVTQAIADLSPRPVLVFTRDSEAEHMERAIDAGIHAYVINGYAASRLNSLIQLAQARFRRDKAQADALLDVTSRLEERKTVERAKGILMHARQMSDDDAFQILRTASMHTNQRLGQVSQHIIDSALFAESVNRAGQLRMLSQRLVKLYLLQLAGVQVARHKACLKDSMLRVDGNFALLEKNLSKPLFGDLLGQLVLTWTRLKHALQGAPCVDQLTHVDEIAETLLQEAERLTGSLENAGSMAPLHVLNRAGRQRMLSQRFAKYALLGVLGDATARQRSEVGMAGARAEFEQGLSYLNSLPLTTQNIRSALNAAAADWQHMLAGAAESRHTLGLARLANASEALLDVFDQLSGYYEHSMQMLVG